MRSWINEAEQALLRRATQQAAFFIATGVELAAALGASPAARAAFAARLTRLLERERLRGLRRHWSYDLNRHIALKQALDLLIAASQRKTAPEGAV